MRCVGPTLSEKEMQNLQDQYSFHPELEERAEFYNLISNPIRLKIIHLLREKEAVCVCDFKDIFGGYHQDFQAGSPGLSIGCRSTWL